MRLSFSKPILSLVSNQYSSIYLSPFVNPNLGSSSQLFIIRTNLFKFSIPNQHLKPMIDLTILKILSILTCEPTMPMTWQTKYDKLINYYSWFIHQIKGLNGLACVTTLLKKKKKVLKCFNETSLIEANDPNTSNSITID